MCPVCLAHLAMLTAGLTSGGGLAAFVVNKFYLRKIPTKSKGTRK